MEVAFIKPEWKTVIYHLVIVAALVFSGFFIMVQSYKKDKFQGFIKAKWKVYLIIESVSGHFLWTSAAFKMIVYADRQASVQGCIHGSFCWLS